MNQSLIDGLPQIDVAVTATESLNVDQCLQRAVLQRFLQHLFIHIRSVPEDMGVAIDQARQHGHITEVEHIGARRDVDITCRPDLYDAASFNQDDLFFCEVVRLAGEQASGANCHSLIGASLWRRKWWRRWSSGLSFLCPQRTGKKAESEDRHGPNTRSPTHPLCSKNHGPSESLICAFVGTVLTRLTTPAAPSVRNCLQGRLRLDLVHPDFGFFVFVVRDGKVVAIEFGD